MIWGSGLRHDNAPVGFYLNKSYSYELFARVSEYDNSGWLLTESVSLMTERITSALFVVVPVESTITDLITLNVIG